MVFLLLHEQTIPENIRRVLLACVDEAREQLTSSEVDRDIAVHEARKLFKRARAVLRLVRDEIGPEAFRAENILFRDAARQLSDLRDAWVLIETLDQVSAAADLPASAVNHARHVLTNHYEQVLQQSLHDEGRIETVVEQLELARTRLADLPVRQDNFAALAGGLLRVYRRGYRRMNRAYATRDHPELFHDWRKRVKYLWHQMELLSPIWPALLDEMSRELHNLSDLLGEAHDMVVLGEVLGGGLGKTLHEVFGCDSLLKAVQARRSALETAARPVGRRLYAEGPPQFVNRIAVYFEVWRETGVSPIPPAPVPQPAALLSTTEAAAALGLPPGHVRAMIQDDRLRAQKVSGQWIILAGDLPAHASPD